MDITLIINNNQYNYSNVNSYDHITNEDGSCTIFVDDQEVLVAKKPPETMSTVGFANKTTVEQNNTVDSNTVTPPSQRKNPLENVTTIGKDIEKVDKSYQTVPYDIYQVLDDRSAYQLIATAAKLKQYPGLLSDYLIALFKQTRTEKEIKQMEFDKHYSYDDVSITQPWSEQIHESEIYTIRADEEKWMALPEKLYVVAATDVAQDLIATAASHIDETTSYADALKDVCNTYLSDTQLEALNISPEQPSNDTSDTVHC